MVRTAVKHANEKLIITITTVTMITIIMTSIVFRMIDSASVIHVYITKIVINIETQKQNKTTNNYMYSVLRTSEVHMQNN